MLMQMRKKRLKNQLLHCRRNRPNWRKVMN